MTPILGHDMVIARVIGAIGSVRPLRLIHNGKANNHAKAKAMPQKIVRALMSSENRRIAFCDSITPDYYQNPL
jgi:hypothetical protein